MHSIFTPHRHFYEIIFVRPNVGNGWFRFRPVWSCHIGLFVSFISVALSLLLAACTPRDQGGQLTNEVQTAPVIGGMAAPAVIPTPSMPPPAPTVIATWTPANHFTPGQTIHAVKSGVSLYADASRDALLLDTYSRGSRFIVLEPNGDYERYPVQREGLLWIRLRASDGLAGWAIADEFSP
jgi:hypothetical protein